MKSIPRNSDSIKLYYDERDQTIQRDFSGLIWGSAGGFFFGALACIMVFAVTGSPVNNLTGSLVLFTGIVSALSVYYLPVLEHEYIRRSSKLPHETIPNFLEWEEGDLVKMTHFAGEYEGVTEDNKIIFSTSGYMFGNKNEMRGKSQTYFALNPTYVGKYLQKNRDLMKRVGRKNDSLLRKQAKKDSMYTEFVKSYKEEKDKLTSKEEVKV